MKPGQCDQIIRGAIVRVFSRASNESIKSIVAAVRNAYGEQHRDHHDICHPAEMLEEAQNYSVEDVTAFKSAIIFHDFKMELRRYLPGYTGPTNERESADTCKQMMIKHGITRTSTDRAYDLIMVTEKHRAPANDLDALRLIDLDISVLGSDRGRYRRYALGIAREFLTVLSPEDYIKGRTKFLNSWIERDHIYGTDPFTLRDEQARENMSWERDNLPAIIAQLIAKPNPALVTDYK